MISKQSLDIKLRLASAIVDHMVMTMVFGVFAIPYIIHHMTLSMTPQKITEHVGPLSYIMIVGFALYLCKDCLDGQSFAKRILKLQVVNKKTNNVASPLRCFFRNIFIIILPIEGIIILINPSRRLGDFVAGTKIVSVEKASFSTNNKIPQICCSFLLAYLFVLILFLVTYN